MENFLLNSAYKGFIIVIGILSLFYRQIYFSVNVFDSIISCSRKKVNILLKKQGKGSFLLPCPKMPIGIFLFSLKFDFQKNEKNGVKRRKPEKISGFSVGIFFVNTC